jgi:hypothetical protein
MIFLHLQWHKISLLPVNWHDFIGQTSSWSWDCTAGSRSHPCITHCSISSKHCLMHVETNILLILHTHPAATWLTLKSSCETASTESQTCQSILYVHPVIFICHLQPLQYSQHPENHCFVVFIYASYFTTSLNLGTQLCTFFISIKFSQYNPNIFQWISMALSSDKKFNNTLLLQQQRHNLHYVKHTLLGALPRTFCGVLI